MKKLYLFLKNRQLSIRSIILIILLLAIFGGFAVVPVQAQDYDLVILNGRVMDPETNFDGIRNVGIKDGKIAVITKDKIKGKETIDATGLVVAPGFIDGHQHCQEPYAYRLMVRDGRTTIMDLEIGAFGEKVDEWYKRREGNSPINFGVAVAHEFARAAVLDGFNDWKYLYTPDALRSRAKGEGWSKTRPTLEQGNQILKIMDEGLRQGGIGIGSTVGYMRAGVSSREILRASETFRAVWPPDRHAFQTYTRHRCGRGDGYPGNAGQCRGVGFTCPGDPFQ